MGYVRRPYIIVRIGQGKFQVALFGAYVMDKHFDTRAHARAFVASVLRDADQTRLYKLYAERARDQVE
jgi:hypothetical protein